MTLSPVELGLVPQVQKLTMRPGRVLLKPGMRIAHEGPGAADAAELLAHYLTPTGGDEAEAQVRLIAREAPADTEFPDESYELEADVGQVLLSARCQAGLLRGVQTLRQLLPNEDAPAEASMPCVIIEDRPRFAWRGLHVDVARHLFSVEALCRFIDLMALHRFNRLHLHLTDDQGWRIEIKRYPRLTEVGGWRPETLVGSEFARPRRYDGRRYGGFYTQEEIRRIVEFATARGIAVMPEIDMPGHMQAAIAAYPELGNGQAPRECRCHWGISHNILNVEPETMRFVREVLEEVTDLFPGRYVHIGGDEVPKYEWENNRRVQARMREYGVPNEAALQGWFTCQVGAMLAEHGRTLIGWDEILEGGVPAGVGVMAWRGEQHAIAAATRGHDVIMAPYPVLYFDQYQADPIAEEPLAFGAAVTTDRVYAYDPVPDALPADCRHHVLGAQGQLWSEYIRTPEHLDYMAFPRACALAERLWTGTEKSDFAGFCRRMQHHRRRLDAFGCHYGRWVTNHDLEIRS